MVRTRSSAKGLGVILVLTRFRGGRGQGEAPGVPAAGGCGRIPHVPYVTQCYIGARGGGAAGADVAAEWLMERELPSRKLTECVGQLSFFDGEMTLPGRNAQGVILAGQAVSRCEGRGVGGVGVSPLRAGGRRGGGR